MATLKLVCRRWMLAVAATVLLVSALTVVGSPSAAAATCAQSHYYYVPSEAAAVSFDWNPECADGTALIWNGTLYDTLCDARSAQVYFKVYDRLPDGSYSVLPLTASQVYTSGTGCGGSSTFNPWRTYSPGSAGWKLTVFLRACNKNGCSTTRSYDFFG